MTRTVALRDLGLVDYREAWEYQRALVRQRQEDAIGDTLLLLEHPSVYTVGRSGRAEGLTDLEIPVLEVERGGDVTYHGPGQLVGYPILALPRGKLEIKGFIRNLEEVLIRTVADLGVEAGRGPHAGLWLGPRKLGSIGVAVKGHVTYHGFALNVNNELEPFLRIRPCGLDGSTLTSLREVLGHPVSMARAKESLVAHFESVYGATVAKADTPVPTR